MSSVRIYPLQLPSVLVEGHGFQPEPNARERARDQGEMRLRPRWRSVPELCTVSWLYVEQAQFDAFDAWYEDQLLAGSLDFDLLVQDRGTPFGRRWYTAQFVGDYRCEVLDALMYRVSATLRLVEDLGTLRIPPGVEATIGLRFGFSAQTSAPPLAATIGLHCGLQAQMPLGALAASIGLNSGLAWVLPPPPPLGDMRETDAGDARETDAGATRETD